jgi:hypothetical protein
MTNADPAGNGTEGLRFRASPHTVAQRVGDEVVLVHVETDKIFVLNRTGARLWELLASGLERSDIERQLLQEFDVGVEQLVREVDALVASLQDERLIDPA